MNYFDSLTQFLDRSDRINAEKFWANALVIQIAKGNIKTINGKIDFQETKNFESNTERYYLGKLGTQHYFAVNLDPGDAGQNLRQLAPSLTEIEITMAMQATSLINWHETHQCCSRCGAKTIVVSQGWVRQCEVDGAQHFPRTDPAVIVLVTDSQNRLLLGRQKVWAEGKFSNFAGFVEPGETLEQTARRELGEESGYRGPIKLQPLARNAKYATFIGVVPHEFEPRPCDEWKDYCWVELGKWPSPLHPGVAAALDNVYIKEDSIVNEKINRDIRNPKFEHTQQIGDYTYKATVEIFMGDPLLWIKAYHGNKEIGHVLFELYGDHLESGGTEVDPKYRNKGIASTMYAYAKMLGNDITPSFNRTDQGRGMWAAWNKSGDAKHLAPDVKENFADGKNPGRKGLSRRVGIPKKASLSKLQKIASSSTGERRRMAQWQLNMRRGKAKKK